MPQIADAAICYGGHSERNPYLWTPERFGRSVTYVDESGSEHWLFDNFIMMELWTDSYNVTYSIAADGRYSSRKEHWQQQLDYKLKLRFKHRPLLQDPTDVTVYSNLLCSH